MTAALLSLVALGCTSTQATAKAVPSTVAEAVAELKTNWLDANQQEQMLRSPREYATVALFPMLGMAIRNEWRLWGDNEALRQSCGTHEPDDCSAVILDELWQSIRRDAPTELVRALDCQFALTSRVRIDYRGFYAMTMGEMLGGIQKQITTQLPATADPSCPQDLVVETRGDPDLACWVRAEFSEDPPTIVSLDHLLGWLGFRNSFESRHSPPRIVLDFNKRCSWPQRPPQFQPRHATDQ